MDPSKTLLRRKVRERIAALPPAERRDADRSVSFHLLQLRRGLGSDAVLGYLALGDEVRIDDFLAGALADGCRVFLPATARGSLVLRAWRPSTPLEKDEVGVWVPVGPDVPPSGLPEGTLVAVPGRAFDRAGGRVGRGGGYYDRLLGEVAADGRVVVGAAYGCQLVDEVPMEAHDVRLGGIVTERGFEAAQAA